MRRWVLALGVAIAAGARPAAAEEKKMPSFEEIVRMRVVHTVPGMDQVEARRNLVYRRVGDDALEMDVYRPGGRPAGPSVSAVILIHGGPIPPGSRPKDWGVFVSYGELLAASGLAAVTFNHRFHSPAQLQDAEADVAALVEHVRANAVSLGLDPERLALWCFSGGGPLLSRWIGQPAPGVKALVAYYAVLDLQVPPPGGDSGLSEQTRREHSPAHHVRSAGERAAPLLVARAGLDNAWLNAGIDRFVTAALEGGAALELITHPRGRHGFDIFDDDARSREIIARTLDFLGAHLR